MDSEDNDQGEAT